MPRRQAKNHEILKRRDCVADLYVQSWTQAQIANHLGVSQPTVSLDLKSIRKQWLESAIRDFDAARELELRKIDRIEYEAWKAWKRSQEPQESTKVVNDGSGNKKAQKVIHHPKGDPRYLDQIQKCIAARRALLGLDAPAKISATSPDGEEAYHTHVMAELMRLAEQSPDGPEVIDADFITGVVEQHRLEHHGGEPSNGKPKKEDQG